jgi:hypothetical protein
VASHDDFLRGSSLPASCTPRFGQPLARPSWALPDGRLGLFSGLNCGTRPSCWESSSTSRPPFGECYLGGWCYTSTGSVDTGCRTYPMVSFGLAQRFFSYFEFSFLYIVSFVFFVFFKFEHFLIMNFLKLGLFKIWIFFEYEHIQIFMIFKIWTKQFLQFLVFLKFEHFLNSELFSNLIFFKFEQKIYFYNN